MSSLHSDAEAEAPVLLAAWCKQLTHWKDPDLGKDWGQEEKRATEDETVGWHHQLNEHEFEQNLGDSEGQGNLVCYSPCGHSQTQLSDNRVTSWPFNFTLRFILKKLKHTSSWKWTQMLHLDPLISFLGLYSKKLKHTSSWKRTQMFIATLFLIAKKQRWCIYSSTDQWINKICLSITSWHFNFTLRFIFKKIKRCIFMKQNYILTL